MPQASWLERILRARLLRNMLALWGVQFYRKTLPLITLPYLARVLGPTGWGMVAFCQGFAACISLLVEFGFNLSATREVARSREDPERLAGIFAGVLGAQVLLAGAGIVAGAVAWFLVPLLRENPALLAAGLLWALAEGLNPTWYFLGTERMGTVATLEIVCKSIAAGSIFLFVRGQADTWMVLALQATAPLLSVVFALVLVYRQIPFRVPSWPLAYHALRAGWGMFLFRSAESMYTMGNAFLLGLFAPPAVVGYFAGAEKISRAVVGLFNPIRETLYPRLVNLMHRSPAEAARLARIGMLATTLGGSLMGAALYFAAPLLVRLLLGDKFEPAVTVLRLLALLPPLLSITQSIGLQWLLPLGREQVVNRIILCAGVINIGLAYALCPRLQHIGMAYSVLISEAFVSASLLLTVILDPSRKYLFK